MINNLPKSLIEAARKVLTESQTHIEVDGEMKHRYNSEGKLIHPTEEGIRNFHRWFGDSKAVDEHGRPLVLYHGTGSSFSEFDPLKIGKGTDEGWFGKGFYFTPHKNIANQYAAHGAPNVVPVYIKTTNPHDWRQHEGVSMRQNTENERWDKTKEIMASGKDGVFVNDETIGLGENEHLSDNQWALIVKHNMNTGIHLPRDMVEHGLRNSTATKYDYERYYGKDFANSMPIKKKLREVIVFHPSQIKSAIGNNGNFDTTKDTIHESVDTDYRGEHTAPDESDSPAHDLTKNGTYPEDVYGPDAARHYGDGRDDDAQVISQLHSLRNRPNASVKIYRAVPKVMSHEEKMWELESQKRYILKYGRIPSGVSTNLNKSAYYEKIHSDLEALRSMPPQEEPEKIKIQKGDWVTTNRNYAKDHGEQNLGKNYKILSKTVKASEIYTDGNSLHEFGYHPKEKK